MSHKRSTYEEARKSIINKLSENVDENLIYTAFINLEKEYKIYEGHEVASHSLTHPHLTMCPGHIIAKEVGEDILNLERIFNTSVTTFAFPFSDWSEECVDIIKHIHNIKVIRQSDLDTSFKFPKDLYHVKITCMEIYEALVQFDKFKKDKDAELFVFVSHGYDFYMNHSYKQLELLCKKVKNDKDIEVITMSELTKIMN